MLDWLHNYTHSQDERSLDRRRNTVLEAAARLQSDVDRRDRDRERQERVQRQALRNQRRAELAQRERQRQAEQEERERQDREREEAERRERDREQRENAPPLPPPLPPTAPIVLIPAPTGPHVGKGAVQENEGYPPHSHHETEARPHSQSRSRSRSRSRTRSRSPSHSQRQSQSPNGSSTTVRQNQSTHPPCLDATTESATEREQEGSGNLYPSLRSNPLIPGPYQRPTVEDEVVDTHNDHQPPSPAPSHSPEAQSPEGGSSQEQGEGHDGAAEDARTQNNAANNRLADNAAGTQVPGDRDATTQPDNNNPGRDDPSPVEPKHVIDVEIPHPPLRLGANIDEPPLRDTLVEISQLPEIREEAGRCKKTVKLLFEVVISWFEPAPYKALGESMAYIIEHTSTSEIPRDHDHEPTPGHSLSGKSFDGDSPECLQRLRDRWNHTRSTRCLANKFWQGVKFRLSAMELFLHWEHLQDIFSSTGPELAVERAYLQRLVNSIPGNTQRRGRKDAARLKIAIAPYLGIGGNDGNDSFWDRTIRIGSRAAVFQEHWGLLALVVTNRYFPTTFR